MRLFNINKESLEHVLDYILEHEHDDFIDNASDHHVYYHAVVCAKGSEYAKQYLEELQNEQRQSQMVE